ncbi:PF04448 family protein [Klebsiella pneumoniae VAKPC309]|nr:PF04448 family protein [Klebsiella pneumoniae VAKPC269]EOZ56875.1 PF04448 family protein [Klebsiella pneumoniae VAKPC309]EPN94669.1 PF04448 family protein [Klebsiella pneumoniae UHKPC47]EPO90902.1 PF04448 family protein [Klebsiella pneumoniae 160_1080]
MARMALAAMDSEPVEMPLDYLQGHKDGLEWAAQLAEANHPETGDWLYDDPIELAKAIRKGPDMPPAQPAADSEPVAIIDQANLDYLRSGADADVWPPEREEMGDVLLYRHAQPAPVVPDDFRDAMSDLLAVLDEYPEQLVPINRDSAVVRACRAAMLQELQKSAGAEATCRSNKNVQVLTTINPAPTLDLLPKNAESLTSNPPAQSDCCPAQNHVSPEQNGDTPAQSQGWIPVSERLPDEGDHVLVSDGVGMEVSWIRGREWKKLRHIYSEDVTHWMPLPAAPQEVKNV